MFIIIKLKVLKLLLSFVKNMKPNYIHEYIIKISSKNIDDMEEDYGFFYDIEKEDTPPLDYKYRIKPRRYPLSEDELNQSRMNLIIINKYN